MKGGSKGTGGGTSKGTKVNSFKDGKTSGWKSYSQTMIDKHGSSGHAAIGDPDDFDGIGEK